MKAQTLNQAALHMSLAWSHAPPPPLHQAGDHLPQVQGPHGQAQSQSQKQGPLKRRAMFLIKRWLPLTMMTMKMNQVLVKAKLAALCRLKRLARPLPGQVHPTRPLDPPLLRQRGLRGACLRESVRLGLGRFLPRAAVSANTILLLTFQKTLTVTSVSRAR